MNILIIHEIDWIEKVIFEPHHLAELFSIAGNNVFVLDCPNSNIKNLFKGFQTKIFKNFHDQWRYLYVGNFSDVDHRIRHLNF